MADLRHPVGAGGPRGCRDGRPARRAGGEVAAGPTSGPMIPASSFLPPRDRTGAEPSAPAFRSAANGLSAKPYSPKATRPSATTPSSQGPARVSRNERSAPSSPAAFFGS